MEVGIRLYCGCHFDTRMEVALVPVQTFMLISVHNRYKRKRQKQSCPCVSSGRVRESRGIAALTASALCVGCWLASRPDHSGLGEIVTSNL